jgi:MarR family transcriptional regulator, lower aerobic nicotinate degradation pathway regulator
MERATLRDEMKNRIPEELVSSPVFLLKRLGMKAKELHFDAYSEAGIHPYHYAVLATLAKGERETQGAIADALDYDRGQLVGILDELEEQGLVERRRDPEDRRRQVVVMTAEGKKALTKMRALAKRLDDEFLASLTQEQRVVLQQLLLVLAEEHVPNCQVTGATLVTK